MQDPSDSLPVLEVVPAESSGERSSPFKWLPQVLAWIVIAAMVTLTIGIQAIRSEPAAEEGGSGVEATTMKLSARVIVGMEDMFGSAGQFYEQAKALNTGPVEQRLCFITLAGELAGPKEALHQLAQLHQQLEAPGKVLTQNQRRVAEDLRLLYEDYAHGRLDAPSLDKAVRNDLHKQIGWFGDLALAPRDGPDPQARTQVLSLAHRAALTMIVVITVLGLLGLSGFVGLVFFLVLLFTDRLQRGLRTGSMHGGVYAETFALWIVLFEALSIASAFLPHSNSDLLIHGLVSLLSLSVLIWPVVRGVPWGHVRWDVGLTGGRRPALEPLLGVANYAMTLPIAAVGLLLTVGLMKLQTALHPGAGPPHAPSHPIAPLVTGGDWWGRIQVFLLACVVAPFLEEIMFRGVLYRHLREATRWLGTGFSILVSTTAGAFIFAAIHPQGLLAVPALMAIAFGLTFIREWRGTLVPGMVTHGMNNGVVMLFLVLATVD
jgi:membrane protease YdiL (CAAX protease family)